MVAILVEDVQVLIDRHNQLAIDEARLLSELIEHHPFETLVGVYPATPSMDPVGTCLECDGPELTVQDSLSLRPTSLCRDCINGMRRFSLRHRRAADAVCIDCTTSEPRKDSYGLYIGPWYHQTMQIEDTLDADGVVIIEGLRSKISAGNVSLDDTTNEVTFVK